MARSGLGGEARPPSSCSRRRTLQEGLGQQQDVARPLPQGRQVDHDHPEAVVEVLPEAPRLNRLLQVAVGGGHDPGVDRDLLPAADALDGLLLEEAQELHLQGGRQFADLVQEERAALGQLDAPLALDVGAGEGPLLVAEEFALQQVLRDGAAVDRDEGPVFAAAQRVDGPGRQLLAGAAFAR